jgi:hypothetical protein
MATRGVDLSAVRRGRVQARQGLSVLRVRAARLPPAARGAAAALRRPARASPPCAATPAGSRCRRRSLRASLRRRRRGCSTARLLSIQSTRSLCSRPWNASIPTGRRSPAAYQRASALPDRSQPRSGLPSPARSAVIPNFCIKSSAVSAGGAYTGAPRRSARSRASRSCHGAVSTITGSRSAASARISFGTAIGSNSSTRPPVVDGTRRNLSLPGLFLRPVGMCCLPVPESRLKLAHSAS